MCLLHEIVFSLFKMPSLKRTRKNKSRFTFPPICAYQMYLAEQSSALEKEVSFFYFYFPPPPHTTT